MAEEIANANIEHFKKLLQTEASAEKRRVIERLSAEKEQKLAALKKRSDRKDRLTVSSYSSQCVHIDERA